MTPTDRFNPLRTISLTALYVNENRRTLLLRAALVTGALICIAVLALPFSHYGDWPDYDYKLRDLGPMYYFAGIVLACLGASLMMDDLKTRQGRIRLLMQPSPMAEKYIARWLIYVAAFIIFYFVAVAIADAVRVSLASIFYPDYKTCHIFHAMTNDSQNTRELLGPQEHRATLLQAITAIYFVIQSFFVLGSTVWYRNSFIKTFIVFGVITAAYFACIIPTGEYLWADKIWPEDSWIVDHIKEVMLTAAAAATIFNWSIGCLRMHETDVITTSR